MTFVPILVLFLALGAVYVVFARRANRAPTGIGPQGRWWGLKLLVGLAVTVAALVVLIAGYVAYVNANH
jgi:hypothetical protein